MWLTLAFIVTSALFLWMTSSAHLLAQRHVKLEVIDVDDRSIDRTEEILKELTLQDGRVQNRLDFIGKFLVPRDPNGCHRG